MKLTDTKIVERVLEGGRRGHLKGGEAVRKAFQHKGGKHGTEKVNEKRKRNDR